MAELEGKKVAILVDNYFEQAEFTEPKKALEEAGADVTVVATKAGTIQGMNHAEQGDTFEASKSLADVDPADFDALMLPGGGINADALRMEDKARSWVSDYMNQGKPIAAICHAPWLLASAGVIDGHKLTSYFTIQDDLRNAGAEWEDSETVVDGNLLTSRSPEDLPAFNTEMIRLFAAA